MNKKMMKEFAASVGISEIGVSRADIFDDLYTILSEQRSRFGVCPFEETSLDLRCNPMKALDGVKSIITCLFPYYSKKIHPENLSRYACIKDYHQVAEEKLHALAEYISRENNDKCIYFTDTGALCDRYLAYRAGLGFYGKNHMLIHERFGSYFFIGSVLTTAEFEPDAPLDRTCLQCGKCITACPGGALSEEGFDYTRCISYLTQAKELTDEQKRLLSSQKTVFGCDVCQKVCPHNQELAENIMPEFTEEILERIPEDILSMSNREFQKKYRSFPFSWRGRKTIARNLAKKT